MDGEPNICPACGESVDPPEQGRIAQCPHCGEQFFLRIEEPEEEAQSPPAEQDDLDALRIRHIVKLRRSNIRSRTHALVGAIGCGVGAVQLILMARQQVDQHGRTVWAFLYIAAAILAAGGTEFFGHKTLALHRELTRSPPEAPAEPPDFEELSDGSQHARNLEEM